MRGNRAGNFDRDMGSRPGYNGTSGVPRNQSQGSSYGFNNGPPASGGYPPSSSYHSGGHSSGSMPPPPYGVPDGAYGGSPPRADKRGDGKFSPERGYPHGAYDHHYEGGPDRVPSTSNSGGRYDDAPPTTASSRGHYGQQPPYDRPRGNSEAEMTKTNQDLPYSAGATAKRGALPGRGYSDTPQGHRYHPPNGPQPPANAIDHHGRRPPSYQRPYHAPFGAEYERGHHVPTRAGAHEERSGPIPPSPGNRMYDEGPHGLQPQSHASVLAKERQNRPYRYEDRPRTPPTPPHPYRYEDRAHTPPPHGARSQEENNENIVPDPARRLSDIAPSAEGPQPQAPATSPGEIAQSQREDVANVGCTCKKSKCLKLYCQCFAASVMCGPNCRCLVCHNTPRHSRFRKDAIRGILARNPQAFETKFKSTDKVAAKARPVLAHKSGCKCRKSACLKKYCECYHASVKCSANCRCIGCRNMPPGGFGPGTRPEHSLVARSFAADVYSMKNNREMWENKVPHHSLRKRPGKNGEPWMVDAAQNLTFLKNGSPQRPEKGVVQLHEAQAVASMPSLVSSDTSPDSVQRGSDSKRTYDKPPGAAKSPEPPQKAGKVNALLMAAMAMTELTSTSAEDSPRREGTKTAQAVSTPDNSLSKKNDKFQYRSPKRKHDDESVSPASTDSRSRSLFAEKGHNGSTFATPEKLVTPVDDRHLKRSRIGSDTLKIHGIYDDEPGENPVEHLAGSTKEPDEKTASTMQERTPEGPAASALTPVSARCIDFRHMDVNGDDNGRIRRDLDGEDNSGSRVNEKNQSMDVVATS